MTNSLLHLVNNAAILLTLYVDVNPCPGSTANPYAASHKLVAATRGLSTECQIFGILLPDYHWNGNEAK